MKYIHLPLALILLIPAIAIANTGDATMTPLQNAQELRSHLKSLKSLSFTFVQRTAGQMTGRPRNASGKAYFAREESNSKMRWDYQTPDKQVILNDGDTLTLYFEKLNQMIITSADSLQNDITYIFFSGEGNIEDDFIISGDYNYQPGDTSPENSFKVIKLSPRSETSQIKSIQLWVSSIQEIKRIEIRDNFDTVTLLTISNVEKDTLFENGTLKEKNLFAFTPPEGTELIHQ